MRDLTSALACALVLLWGTAPLCGDPSDLDPVSCCEKDGSCSRSAGTGDPLDAADCCALKQPGHLVANLSRSAPIFPPSSDAEWIESFDVPVTHAALNVIVSVCVQAHSPPLYVLLHNYRI
jgi:hypothetical protein